MRNREPPEFHNDLLRNGTSTYILNDQPFYLNLEVFWLTREVKRLAVESKRLTIEVQKLIVEAKPLNDEVKRLNVAYQRLAHEPFIRKRQPRIFKCYSFCWNPLCVCSWHRAKGRT